jgi:hypothetical protein
MKKSIFIIILILFVFSMGEGKECYSDFGCGIGSKCVKAPLQSQGVCMQTVDDYGTRTYDMPKLKSIEPNMNIDGECQFNTDCPIGFECNKTYKVCVKKEY